MVFTLRVYCLTLSFVFRLMDRVYFFIEVFMALALQMHDAWLQYFLVLLVLRNRLSVKFCCKHFYEKIEESNYTSWIMLSMPIRQFWFCNKSAMLFYKRAVINLLKWAFRLQISFAFLVIGYCCTRSLLEYLLCSTISKPKQERSQILLDQMKSRENIMSLSLLFPYFDGR